MLWFGAHSSVSSFCLSSCVYLYVLGKKATYLSLKEVIFHRSCSVWPRSTISCDHKARWCSSSPMVVLLMWAACTHKLWYGCGCCIGIVRFRALIWLSCGLTTVWGERQKSCLPVPVVAWSLYGESGFRALVQPEYGSSPVQEEELEAFNRPCCSWVSVWGDQGSGHSPSCSSVLCRVDRIQGACSSLLQCGMGRACLPVLPD